MNPKVNARQARLLNMLERQEEISVGRERDCPLPVTQLLELKESHPSVLKLYQHGRTAEVFHLKLNGRHWCLKRCRQEALLAHPDGKTAFLTELERRREIEALRELHPTLLANVVCTSFGSAQAGILVSPWLRGEPVHCLNERNLAQMLDVEAELARWGWFDWDPNPSNLLDDGEQISLFDFGYMWTFDPRFEYNSNGLLDPEFHVVERLETRTLSGLWLAEAAPLPLFRYWRELCLKWVQRETDHLTRAGASALVLDRLHQLQRQWTAALASDDELTCNWLHDMYRSHRINVISTQEGTSSDPLVQERLDWLLRALTDHYPQLAPGLTAQEAALGQAGLLEQWQQRLNNGSSTGARSLTDNL